jgi:hypothetical protein
LDRRRRLPFLRLTVASLSTRLALLQQIDPLLLWVDRPPPTTTTTIGISDRHRHHRRTTTTTIGIFDRHWHTLVATATTTTNNAITTPLLRRQRRRQQQQQHRPKHHRPKSTGRTTETADDNNNNNNKKKNPAARFCSWLFPTVRFYFRLFLTARFFYFFLVSTARAIPTLSAAPAADLSLQVRETQRPLQTTTATTSGAASAIPARADFTNRSLPRVPVDPSTLEKQTTSAVDLREVAISRRSAVYPAERRCTQTAEQRQPFAGRLRTLQSAWVSNTAAKLLNNLISRGCHLGWFWGVHGLPSIGLDHPPEGAKPQVGWRRLDQIQHHRTRPFGVFPGSLRLCVLIFRKGGIPRKILFCEFSHFCAILHPSLLGN